MQSEDVNFTDHKKNALAKLKIALEKNNVDSKVISLLKKINAIDSYFTTSSCAGRIVVLQLPEIGNKKQAVFLGRWHRKVTFNEVWNALLSFEKGDAWLLTQPPIFHIGCRSLSTANELMKLGVSCGFKHSGIRSFSAQIIVELQSTERMDMPLGRNGDRFVDKRIISLLVDTANTALIRAQKKLLRLENKIEDLIIK